MNLVCLKVVFIVKNFIKESIYRAVSLPKMRGFILSGHSVRGRKSKEEITG